MNVTDDMKVPEQAGGRNSVNQNHQNSAAETDSSAEERSSGKNETNVRFVEWWKEYAEKLGARFELRGSSSVVSMEKDEEICPASPRVAGSEPSTNVLSSQTSRTTAGTGGLCGLAAACLCHEPVMHGQGGQHQSEPGCRDLPGS